MRHPALWQRTRSLTERLDGRGQMIDRGCFSRLRGLRLTRPLAFPAERRGCVRQQKTAVVNVLTSAYVGSPQPGQFGPQAGSKLGSQGKTSFIAMQP
jgi:hypothetical protein